MKIFPVEATLLMRIDRRTDVKSSSFSQFFESAQQGIVCLWYKADTYVVNECR
jgi:hypothetical protein